MYKVLVVDDETLPREFLHSLVPALDSRYEVIGEASDGNEAMQFIRQNQVDLLITDVRMPEKDGLELCKEVHSEYPGMMIAILSGHEEFQYVQQAMLYKVEEYLLKPINKQSIQGMLQRVAVGLEKRKNEETTLRGLLNLSDEAKRQVATRFLQALIAQSHAEISSLYPLVHRMKIPVFEGEGIILHLSVDEYSLFQRMIPPKDYSVFLYILNQVASELASQFDLTWTLFDSSNQTSILLSGTDTALTLKYARDLFDQINSAMQSVTKLSVSGGIGCWIEDIFQIDVSYQSALRANHLRFQYDGGTLRENLLQEDEVEPDPIERVTESLRNTAIIPNAPEWAAKELVRILQSVQAIYSYNAYSLGAYILNKLLYRTQGKNNPSFETAWKLLSSIGNLGAQEMAAEVVESVYRSVFSSMLVPNNDSVDEVSSEPPSIIEKVLEFIMQHYGEPISLSMIADNFDITPQYLSHIFHRQTGTSYIKYVTHFRLKQAATLLTEMSDVKIYEVAEKVGYENVKHFMYIFKKHFGVTPGEYKTAYGN